MDEYRHNEQTGEVHKFSEAQMGYVYVGNTQGQSLDLFIDDLDSQDENDSYN